MKFSIKLERFKTGWSIVYNERSSTRDVFYVRRKEDLIKTAKVNANIMHIFGKIDLLSLHAT